MGIDETDTLAPHRIAESINKDFERLLSSPEMNAFKSGLSFKSAKTRQTDEALVNLLIDRLRMYKNGWIMSNAGKTNEQWNKNLALDELERKLNEEKKQVKELFKMVNDASNDLIRMMNAAKLIPSDKLEELRAMEREIKSALK